MNFDLENFLPYLLNRAAEQSSIEFQKTYKMQYGMLRTEWRVLFHLGRYGNMTAREICTRGGLHKTKVSRAVTALEKKRYLSRKKTENDKRFDILFLTPNGMATYASLEKKAEEFHHEFSNVLSGKETTFLIKTLKKLTQQ